MASYSYTYSGDLTTTVASFLYNTVQNARGDAKQERATAEKKAAKYGVDPQLKRGEFFKQALPYRFTPSMFREKKFSDKFKYPDYFARGQRSELASPLPSDYYNRGQSSPIGGSSAQAQARRASQPFPMVAVGAPLNQQVQANTPMMASTTKYGSTVNEDKPVKVKDEKLGILFAKVAESLARTVASVSEQQSEINSEITSAKESSIAVAKALEVNTDLVSDKLDQLINVLNQQLAFDKQKVDDAQSKEKQDIISKTEKTSGTDEYADPWEDASAVQQRNDAEDDLTERMNQDPNIPKAAAGGVFTGPDSGYPVLLHGTESVQPIDNNYTQGQPLATGGGIQQFELGTSEGSATPAVTPTTNMIGGQSPLVSPTRTENQTNDASTKDLFGALRAVNQVAGLSTMAMASDAAEVLPDSVGLNIPMQMVTKPIADAFNITDKISNSFGSSRKSTRNSIVSNMFAGNAGGGDGGGIFSPIIKFFSSIGDNIGKFFNLLRGAGGASRGTGGSGTKYSGSTGRTGGPFSWLPGTGRVMAPSGSQYDSRGGTVQKFFGMTVPGSYQRSGYKQEDIDRFNRTSPTQYLEQYKAQPLAPSPELEAMYSKYGIQYTDPAHRVRSRTKPNPNVTPQQGAITGANNTRLNQAIRDAQQIGDRTGTRALMDSTADTAIKAQNRYDVLRQYMRDNNMSGADQNMNIYGKPMGDQSSLGAPAANNIAHYVSRPENMMASLVNHNSMETKMNYGRSMDPVIINMSSNSVGNVAQRDEVSAFDTMADPGTKTYTNAYTPSFLYS